MENFYNWINYGFNVQKLKFFCNTAKKLKIEYELQVHNKTVMQEFRKEGKNKDVPVLLFDPQNVIRTPPANISSFFILEN